MPRQLFLFDRPRRFVAGTVGQPGDRTFFLQAADGARTVVGRAGEAAGHGARRPARAAARRGRRRAPVPRAGRDARTTEALEQPVDEEFRVGAMGLAWDGDAGLVVIEAQAPAEDAEPREETLLEDVEDGPDALRVRIEPAAGPGVRRAGPPGGRRRPAAVPAVRAAARPGRARLPAAERLPPRRRARPVTVPTSVTPPLDASRGGDAGDGAARATASCPSRAGWSTRPTPRSTARSAADGVTAGCVYKPVAGERPLWDFPDGTLAEREVAAYEVSAATGLAHRAADRATATGPLGPGMVQLWIDEDETVDLARLMRRRDSPQLRRMAVLRRGGQQRRPQGRPPAADRRPATSTASTTASASTSRTSCAPCCGSGPASRCPTELPRGARRLRRDLDGQLGERLRQLLTRREVRRTRRRVDRLLSTGRHPRAVRRLAADPVAAVLSHAIAAERCSADARRSRREPVEGREHPGPVAAVEAAAVPGRAGSWPGVRPTAR